MIDNPTVRSAYSTKATVVKTPNCLSGLALFAFIRNSSSCSEFFMKK